MTNFEHAVRGDAVAVLNNIFTVAAASEGSHGILANQASASGNLFVGYDTPVGGVIGTADDSGMAATPEQPCW